MPSTDVTSTPETRGPQARGAATRERLSKAAKELFCRKGYEGTSIGDVASAADVGVGTVYHHFADKRAILLDLLDWQIKTAFVAGADGLLKELLGAADIPSAMESAIRVLGQVRSEQPSIYRAASDLARRDEEIALLCRQIEAMRQNELRRQIEAARRAGRIRAEVDAAATARWLLLLLETATADIADGQDTDARELSEIICSHLLPR